MGRKMKNLIINAFAFREGYQTSMQLKEGKEEDLLRIYMKNIFVSLKSAHLHNPEDDVMLIANAPIPEEYERLFLQHGIKISVIDFDSFVMPKEFVWALAYFKLCALKYAVEKLPYDNILLLDADTVTMHSFQDLWEEARYGVLLYPVGHAYHHRDRELIREDYRNLYPGENKNIIHYGGEFICGRKESLHELIHECEMVYYAVKQKDFRAAVNAGDEMLLSIGARNIPFVIEASAYIYRYWTNDFYLVCTNTIYNPAVIWHLPDEKRQGNLWLYHFYQKKGTFPAPEKAAAMLGIVKARRPWNVYTLLGKVQGKLRKWKRQQ